jgi:hypothetical protein
MDKHDTKELIQALRLILIGSFFWIIKLKYITIFILNKYHFLNIYGIEIIGTVLIMIGILIIHRVYPFPYSYLAIALNSIIFIINISEFFLLKYQWFRNNIFEYTPFVMSLMLFLTAKLMESGTRYFNNFELAKKWEHIAIIIFFGFSVPYYTYTSFKVCGFIEYNYWQPTLKFFMVFIPLFITIAFFFLYYIIALVKTFIYLKELYLKDRA